MEGGHVYHHVLQPSCCYASGLPAPVMAPQYNLQLCTMASVYKEGNTQTLKILLALKLWHP
jgi:hypothetical protein